jgi:hypothetical protein
MKFRVLIFFLFVYSNCYLQGQIVINEIQASNTETLQDEFGEFPDWIEIKNVTDSGVSLKNWYISDDMQELGKWQFPEMIIPSEGYSLIFASGRDLRQVPVNWNTLVDIGDSCDFYIPTSIISDEWKNVGFNPSSWNRGKTGLGYGDGDDSTQIPPSTISVYLRINFTIENRDNIRTLLLHADYDDGFVAYINGIEVARANMGIAYSIVNYDDITPVDREAIMYTGQHPEQFDISAHISLLNDGDNTLAIEVHNRSSSSSDLSIIPFLTIGSVEEDSELTISEYLNLISLFPHTNFKLSSQGESLYLSDSNLNFVDSLQAIYIPANASYGKLAGTDSTGYFVLPTPNSTNDSVGFVILDNDSVHFSNKGGFIAEDVFVSMTNLNNDTIYYTIDGSAPTDSSSIYESAIQLDTSITIRASVLKAGALPGKIYSASFIKNRQPELPVVSLATSPELIWDYNIGMYAMGPNASDDFPHFGANFWNDWEYPFSFTYMDGAGSQVFSENIGAKIFGGWSRGQAQKSFSLFARKQYGSDKLRYKFFQNSSITEFDALVIRNSGNDQPYSMLRDGLMTNLVSDLGLDIQAFQPVVVYLNSEYWGLYNLREKVNEDFLAAHHNLESDEIIILEKNGKVVEGDNSEYLELISFLNINTTLVSEEKYYEVANQIDIDNYIKYQLSQIYFGNSDWPGNNIKFWKTTAPVSKWRWILYDTDFGFGLFSDVNHYTLSFALDPNGPNWPNPPWSTLLFRRLVTNTSYRHNFINQLADNLNTIFRAYDVTVHIDSMSGLIANEMQYHRPRWWQDYDSWEWQIHQLKNYGNLRSNIVRDNVLSEFNLASTQRVQLDVNDALAGHIRCNTLELINFPFYGTYFEGVPIVLEAIPKVGYKFVKWEGDNSTSERILEIDLQATTRITAVFEKDDENIVELVINEINYNSSDSLDSGDWIEIYNPLNNSVDLTDFVFAELNNDSVFVFPEGSYILPGQYIIVANNRNKFSREYPSVLPVYGDFVFGLSSTGDEIRLYDNFGNVLDAVDYLPYNPWPENANGTGYTIELINSDLDNGQPQNWNCITLGGTPGRKNNYESTTVPDIVTPLAVDVNIFPASFSDYATISLNTFGISDVSIEIFNVSGELVHQINEIRLPAGSYVVDWVPEIKTKSGNYFVRFKINNTILTRKIVYLKY